MSSVKKTSAAKVLGARIAYLRKAKNLTQAQLSELINIAPTTLANIESGKRFLTADTLDKIKTVLNVSYQDLFKDSNISDIKSEYNEIKKILARLYKLRPEVIPAIKIFIDFLDE